MNHNKKYHVRRQELMGNENPQIRKFYEKWGRDYLSQVNGLDGVQQNPYGCKVSTDNLSRQTKQGSINLIGECRFQEGARVSPDKTADNSLQTKPDRSFAPITTSHCDGQPLRELDKLEEDLFIGSKV